MVESQSRLAAVTNGLYQLDSDAVVPDLADSGSRKPDLSDTWFSLRRRLVLGILCRAR